MIKKKTKRYIILLILAIVVVSILIYFNLHGGKMQTSNLVQLNKENINGLLFNSQVSNLISIANNQDGSFTISNSTGKCDVSITASVNGVNVSSKDIAKLNSYYLNLTTTKDNKIFFAYQFQPSSVASSIISGSNFKVYISMSDFCLQLQPDFTDLKIPNAITGKNQAWDYSINKNTVEITLNLSYSLNLNDVVNLDPTFNPGGQASIAFDEWTKKGAADVWDCVNKSTLQPNVPQIVNSSGYWIEADNSAGAKRQDVSFTIDTISSFMPVYNFTLWFFANATVDGANLSSPGAKYSLTTTGTWYQNSSTTKTFFNLKNYIASFQTQGLKSGTEKIFQVYVDLNATNATVIRPDRDLTAGFTNNCGLGADYKCINSNVTAWSSGATAGTSLSSGGSNEIDVYDMQNISLGNNNVSTIRIWVYGNWGSDSGAVYADLNATGNYEGEQQFVQPDTSNNWVYVNWSGNWNQAQINKTRIKLRDDNPNIEGQAIYAMYAELNLTATGTAGSSCKTFTTDNEVYTLVSDVSSSGACYVFKANNVTFDFDGHSVTMTGGGIRVPLFNVTKTSRNITIENMNIKITGGMGMGIMIESGSTGNIIQNGVINSSQLSVASAIFGMMVAGNNTLINNLSLYVYASGKNNGKGLDLYGSSNSIVANSTFYTHSIEMMFERKATNNTIYGNYFLNGDYYAMGMYTTSGTTASRNVIYNNFINSSNYVYDDLTGNKNFFNTTQVSAVNILGNSYIAGNYWTNQFGTGTSDTCADIDKNGICDTATKVVNTGTDFLPLSSSDNIAPSVAIYSPENNTAVNGVVQIKVIASDNRGINNVSYTYQNDTSSVMFCTDASPPYSCNWDTSVLSGSYVIIANASDVKGNSALNYSYYSIDTTLPQIQDITEVYPNSQQSLNNQSSVILLVNATDVSGVYIVKANLSLLNPSLQWTPLTFVSGSVLPNEWSLWRTTVKTHTAYSSLLNLQINVTDNTGNSNSGSFFQVQEDNSPPTYIYGDSPDGSLNNTLITFSADVFDNFLLDETSFIFSTNMSGAWVNYTDLTMGGGTTADTISKQLTSRTGNWSYYFTLQDDAGNINTTTATNFQILGNQQAGTTMNVLLSYPNDLAKFNYSNIQMNFSYIDAVAKNCSLTFDTAYNMSIINPVNTTIYNFTLNNIGNGIHSWLVTCIDNVTETAYDSDTRIFTTDIIFPSFTNFLNNNASLVTSGYAWFNVTIADCNGTAKLSINGNNYLATNNSDVYSASVLLTNGTYAYNWSAYGAGNLTNFNRSATYFYTVNDTPPDAEYPQFSNYTDNNASLIGSGIGIFNATITDTNGTAGIWINNTIILATNKTLFLYNVTRQLNNNATYPYYWWAYGNGTNHLYNVSRTRYYTVNNSAGDTTAPYFVEVPQNVSIVYGSRYVTQFNASDNIGFSCFSINDSRFNVNCSGYFYNSSALSAGVIWLNLTINDSSNNKNQTFFYVNVTKATASLTLSATTPITYGTTTDFTGSGCPAQLSCSLNISNAVYPAGSISANYSTAGNINYTASSAVKAVTINKASPTLTVKANSGTSNLTLIYPQQTNISAYNSSATLNLEKDGVNYLANNGLNVTFGVGQYIFKANITGNQNYTDVGNTYYNVTIDKATSSVLTYLGGVNGDNSVELGLDIVLTGNLSVGIGNINISMDNSQVAYGVANQSYTYHATGVPRTVVVNASYSGNQNYTEGSQSWNLDIVAASSHPPLISNIVATPSSPQVYLLGRTYWFNSTITDLGNNIQQVYLSFNGVNYTAYNVTSNFFYNFSTLGAGVYNYYWWANDTTGLVNQTILYQYNITQAAGNVTAWINNTRSNYTAFNDTLTQKLNVWLNGTRITGEGIIRLLLNGDIINSGTSPLSNLTNLSIGNYNFTAYLPATQNYTSWIETWWINISATPTPECVQNLQNTSWGDFTNFGSCLSNDVQQQIQNLTQYDANNCGYTNTTFYNYTNVSCNYAAPVFTNCRNLTGYANQSFSQSITATDNTLQNYTLNQTDVFNVNSVGLIFNITQLDTLQFWNLNLTVNDSYDARTTCFFDINIIAKPISGNGTANICRYKKMGYWNDALPFYHEVCV